MPAFSDWLQQHRDAQNPQAVERIRVAMARLPNILERETVAHQKTLEQKISDQGPTPQRVDPHLLGLAIRELSVERRILRAHAHDATPTASWYANARATPEQVQQKLESLAPLYAQVSSGNFPNLVGDALEVIVFKALQSLNTAQPRYSFQGALRIDQPKNRHGRYKKVEPPNVISGHATQKRADFILSGFDAGPISIECKNYREWIYPQHAIVKETIQKSIETKTTPLLVARRLHYTTIRNLLEPAGIIAHESYYQYYPEDHAELADQVRHKRSLGFTDVRATEDPHPRTTKFFERDLPRVADRAAIQFRANEQALWDYIGNEINLAQLYNAIGSPAAGNWIEPEDMDPDEFN